MKIIEFQGDRAILTVEVNDVDKTQIKVVVQSRDKKNFKMEGVCYLHFPQKIIHLFNSGGEAIINRN